MLIQTREQFLHARTVLLDADKISIDTETNGFDGEIIGFATYCLIKGREPLGISFYFPMRHQHDETLFSEANNIPLEWVHEDMEPVWERLNVEWIFHNLKFDIKKFWNDDIYIKGKTFCTMIMSHMENENTLNSLDACGERFLGRKKVEGIKKIAEQLGGWNKVPPDVMAHYCEQDAVLTFDLDVVIRPLIEAQEMANLLPVEMQFSKCLAEIEQRGIRIDTERAKVLAYETEQRLQAIQTTLGFDPAKKGQLAHKLFEPVPEGLGLIPEHLSRMKLASPITLSNGRTIGFIPVMDKGALEKFKHPTVDLVLEYRTRQKALSTWFLGFLQKVGPDQRLHPTFKQHGTLTSRLSCENPNVQQIPRTTEEERENGISKAQVKELFLPSDGFELWEFDYSQIEFRLAACYAKEESIIAGYNSGIDFHQTTANLLGISRQDAKTINFLILYGGGANRLVETMWKNSGVVMSDDEARSVLAEWRATFPRLRDVIQTSERAAHRGYVRYWDGRRRHFQFPSEYHKAFNSICQGGAARIVIKSMNEFYNLESVTSYRMVAQIHDALWFEIPEGDDKARDDIKRIMEWPSNKFALDFPVESKLLATSNSNNKNLSVAV